MTQALWRYGSRDRALRQYVLFVFPFILLLVFFRSIDVFDKYFFASVITLPYNLFRILYVVYLGGAICVPGFAALKLIGGATGFSRLRPLERLAACFFCGAALWHALLLLFGFLNLYDFPVMAALIVVGVALTPVYLRDTIVELHRDARATQVAAPRPIAYSRTILAIAAAAAAIFLLLVKGLYPAGGHDFYDHYNGFYEAVIRNHGIWPNDLWYHFYYSKGLGLFFLSMIVTDPLAPSLVTFCFVMAAATALFLLIDRMAPEESFWPWIAVITYLVFYVYTPGFGLYLQHGGWGDFQKPHEIGSAFVVGFLWLCAGLTGVAGRERWIWLTAAAAIIFILPVIELPTVFLLGLLSLILMIAGVIRRRKEEFWSFFLLSVAGGCGLAGILVLNYVVTGLPSDEFVVDAWPWADVRRLSASGALPYVILLVQGWTGLLAQAVPLFSGDFLNLYVDQLRLNFMKSLFINTSIFFPLLGGCLLWRRRWPRREQDSAPLWLILALLAALAVAAAFAGRVQTISFYRYTSFCLPVVIGLAACGWLYLGASINWRRAGVIFRYILPVVILVVALNEYRVKYRAPMGQVVGGAAAFAAGALSIREAYSHQQGWPGRMLWGGIYPGMIGAWRVAGPGTRIWSLHLHTYCMLPHCRSETFYSFILSPHLLDLLVASGDQVRDVLQHEGLNYFFYTTEREIQDALPLIKPFAPDNIADYLGIKWTDGTSYLLTWLGPGVAPLTPEWVAQYKQAVATGNSSPNNFSLSMFLDLRKQMRGNPHWGRDLKLPGIGGD
jgi:hypothetical protein